MVSEADSYAGMWIQHEPDFRVIVRFTERGEETLLPYLADSPLAELVEVRGASITLAVLAEEQQALGETLQRPGDRPRIVPGRSREPGRLIGARARRVGDCISRRERDAPRFRRSQPGRKFRSR
jgi:hypothetical protein